MNKKIISFFLAMLLCISVLELKTQAAGGLSISASSSQVSENGTFTVTISAAGNYFVSNVVLNVSGGTIVSNLGATSLDKGESTTATIKLTGDNCVVSVSGVGANYDTETEGTASASTSVKKKVVANNAANNNNSGNSNSNSSSNSNKDNSNNTTTSNDETKKETKSSDNTLKSLEISEGKLSPEFKSSTTAYSVSVKTSVEKITVSAYANHGKATVTGTGEKTLKQGHNELSITCEAEDGTQKKYKIDVYREEEPEVFASYNGKTLGVVKNQENIGIPETFEETTVLLEEKEVRAYKSNQYQMTLIYMVNENEEKQFYIYEENKGITSLYRPVSLLGRNVILYDLTEEEMIRENMIYQEVTIDDVTLYGWVYENPDFDNYIHVPVINEFGEKIIYQYEKTENSLQIYREYVAMEKSESEEKVEETTGFEKLGLTGYGVYIVLGLSLLVVCLTVTILVVLLMPTHKHSVRRKKHMKNIKEKARKE